MVTAARPLENRFAWVAGTGPAKAVSRSHHRLARRAEPGYLRGHFVGLFAKD
jgi:hypothetical protein